MPMQSFRAARGDAFRLVSAGGGGAGDPLRRDVQSVLHDVIEGRVSAQAARRDYGVVLAESGDSIDLESTRSLRERMRKERGRAAAAAGERVTQ